MSNEAERSKVSIEIFDLTDVLDMIELNCDIFGHSVPKIILQLAAKKEAYQDCMNILHNNERF